VLGTLCMLLLQQVVLQAQQCASLLGLKQLHN
jgi:hypothetical protein